MRPKFDKVQTARMFCDLMATSAPCLAPPRCQIRNATTARSVLREMEVQLALTEHHQAVHAIMETMLLTQVRIFGKPAVSAHWGVVLEDGSPLHEQIMDSVLL